MKVLNRIEKNRLQNRQKTDEIKKHKGKNAEKFLTNVFIMEWHWKCKEN